MLGAIDKTDVLFHPLVTIRCFGWTVFFRAAFAGRQTTFLSLLTQSGTFERPITPMGEMIDRCIELERRAMRLYESIAARYDELDLVREFFEHLSLQERAHAELLSVCRAAVGRRSSPQKCFQRMSHSVPQTERRLDRAELFLQESFELSDALRLVIELESSQINDLFSEVVAATDPGLDERFQSFRGAIRDHLGYIRERIPRLEPSMREACKALALPAEKGPSPN